MDTTLRYDPNLVQQMFLHSLLTGLKDDNIRLDLKFHIGSETTDEELFKRIKTGEEQEEERKHKQKSRHSKVNQVTAEPSLLEQQLKQIQADLAALKASPPVRNPTGNTRSPNEWGCKSCREASKGRECTHCFKCGGSDHYLRGCRLRRNPHNSGNERGGPQRDEGHPPANPSSPKH